MADYGSYCPIALGSEIVADRWTPLILREMIIGNTRFNDIARGLPGISRSLLVQRLRHLESRGVVETWPSPTGKGHEYHLTPAGQDLQGVILGLGRWAIEWLFEELRPHDVDSLTLTWWMHRRVNPERFPPHRVVVEFRHTAPQRDTYWLVLDHGEASVCLQHPGFDVDVIVTSTTGSLADVFQGYRRWPEAVADGRIEIDGSPRLVHALPSWFSWSPFVDVTYERAERAARAALAG
ncbi:winged helix-turn-helix transcriptional regulator [Microbacterium invictum]|nr:helix-turn-helix domain-containing protein [Microbacterium invictum]